MMNAVIKFFRFLFSNKWKILFTLLCSIFFLLLLFPYNDLNELVTSQVSKLTQNHVYLQFNQLNLNPLGPSLTLQKVSLETPQTPTINIDELHASPSIMSLVRNKIGGEINVHGFLKGNLYLKATPAGKSEAGHEKTKFEISGDKLSLNDMRDLARLPVALKGQFKINSTSVADLSMSEQPEGDVVLVVDRFEMPSGNVNLGEMGRINIPEIKFSQVELRGKLSAGKLALETGKLGSPKDELFGNIKGQLGLNFVNMGGQIVPNFTTYDLNIDLKANPQFKERAKFFLSFLDGYKTDQTDGTQYRFRLQGSAYGTPQFTPLR